MKSILIEKLHNFDDKELVEKIKSIPEFDTEIIENDLKLDYYAYKYYNDYNYWIIIGIYNDIIDPFNDTLKILKIPKMLYINEIERDMIIKNNKG